MAAGPARSAFRVIDAADEVANFRGGASADLSPAAKARSLIGR
jgi:hypothetical protein